MPWLIALFLVMVFWLPFESITLPISLPINSDLDRFVVGGIAAVWAVSWTSRPGRVRMVHAPFNVALFAFVALAVLSMAVNLRAMAWDGDLPVAIKQFALIGSYAVAFFFTATSIRKSEVPAYCKLLVALGIGTALGTIVQFETGTNIFYDVSSTIFVGAHVQSLGAAVAAISGPGSRPGTGGPTLHPLADATLISTAVPFCICAASSAKRYRGKLLWSVGLVILIGGCLTTGRKTALFVPAVAFLVLCAYSPREYVGFLIAPLLAILTLLIVSPSELNHIFSAVSGASSSSSTNGRTADYAAVVPDILSHLLLGRGYGSFDPLKYRILDNQILGFLVQVGVFGTVAYIAMMVASVVTVHRVARRAGRSSDNLMRAVAASSIGFLLTNFLYDTFGFRPAPYSFFVVAALGVAYCGKRVGDGPNAPPPTVTASMRDDATESSTPLVSVLVVTYKNPELTRECLSSLASEIRVGRDEVLLMDNDSGDGTADVVAAEFPWIDLERSTSNIGFARANNLLAERSRAEFLLLLNPDTIVHPGMISALLELAEHYPDSGLYAGRTLTPAGELDRRNITGFMTLWSLFCFATLLSTVFKGSRLFDPESLGNWDRMSVRKVDMAAGCLLMVRREIWNELGGFDTDFWMYGEDLDLAMRASRHGYRIMYTPRSFVTHVLGASSSPGTKTTLVLGCKVRLMRKHWGVWRARLGIAFMLCGCGIRAAAAKPTTGWRESWERRREWLDAGLEVTEPARA